MPKPTTNKARWPDRKAGPWEIETSAAYIGGRWELVGLSIRPLGPPIALTSSVLKRLSLPELFVAHQRSQHHELLAKYGTWEIKVAPGSPGFEIRLGGRKVSTPEAKRIHAFLVDEGTPRIGRPLHWTPERLAEITQVYLEAWSAGKQVTTAVASRFHISASTAAKVVKLARASGLLRPTTKGKAGGIERPPTKIAKHNNKETKR